MCTLVLLQKLFFRKRLYSDTIAFTAGLLVTLLM